MAGGDLAEGPQFSLKSYGVFHVRFFFVLSLQYPPCGPLMALRVPSSPFRPNSATISRFLFTFDIRCPYTKYRVRFPGSCLSSYRINFRVKDDGPRCAKNYHFLRLYVAADRLLAFVGTFVELCSEFGTKLPDFG